MDKLKIRTSYPIATAIRQGQAQAGIVDHPLTGVLPLLSDEERDWLATQRVDHTVVVGQYRDALVTLQAPPTDETVAEAIRATRSSALAEAKKKAEEAEERIQAALKAPLDAWIGHAGASVYHRLTGDYTYRPVVMDTPDGPYYVPGGEARLVARRAEAEAYAAPRIQQWEADHAKWKQQTEEAKAQEAREKARKAEEKAKVAEAVRLWAAECEELPPNIQRAARDGFDVYPAVKKHAAREVRKVIATLVNGIGTVVSEYYGEEPANRVPSEDAYWVFDQLEKAKEDIADAAIVPHVAVTVGPFLRLDVAEEGTPVWRSAIEVAVLTPWLGDVGTYVLTEPLEEDDDE